MCRVKIHRSQLLSTHHSGLITSLYGPRGSRTHCPSLKRRELILMSFRPVWCSGRDSNSDHALIWCLRGISSPLCRLSYRSDSKNWCARTDSNRPLTLKRRVLRHQSFERTNEPGRIRTCVHLFRRQMPDPLGYRPNKRGRRDLNSHPFG